MDKEIFARTHAFLDDAQLFFESNRLLIDKSLSNAKLPEGGGLGNKDLFTSQVNSIQRNSNARWDDLYRKHFIKGVKKQVLDDLAGIPFVDLRKPAEVKIIDNEGVIAIFELFELIFRFKSQTEELKIEAIFRRGTKNDALKRWM